MTYTIVRQVPLPTFEQLERPPAECCVRCLNNEREPTKIMPPHAWPGMETLMELTVGDAIDTEKKYRNILGIIYRAYDFLNDTKHEIFMITPETARCMRIK